MAVKGFTISTTALGKVVLFIARTSQKEHTNSLSEMKEIHMHVVYSIKLFGAGDAPQVCYLFVFYVILKHF